LSAFLKENIPKPVTSPPKKLPESRFELKAKARIRASPLHAYTAIHVFPLLSTFRLTLQYNTIGDAHATTSMFHCFNVSSF
jgi:hypothetical protein